jgi:thioredoxin reductase (NADPH)
MIAGDDLKNIPIFDCLDGEMRSRVAGRAADLQLDEDEWLIREGEVPSFFVLLEGRLALLKDIFGKVTELHEYSAGEFFGEVPILLGALSFVSVRAKTAARVARFDRQELQQLIQSSEKCSAIILQTMTLRLMDARLWAKDKPASRVIIVGSQYDIDCRDIRSFLSANRIPHEWVDRERDADRVPACIPADLDGPAVVVDDSRWLKSPTVRIVAEALGLRTLPEHTNYDVVIAGAGPAGMAAGVYGASEGLKVLIVERSSAGGQAGTSSRIENYLGFPGGISGDELSDRALKQAGRFGAEITMTRSMESLVRIDDKYCIQLDGGERVFSRVVLLATGVDWHRLDVEGIDRFRGRGVLYGASRTEARSVIGKKVFLVGAGNSAGQAAVFFSNYAAQVNLLVRASGLGLSMSQYLIKQIAQKHNVRVEPFTEVISVTGGVHLEQIVTRTRPREDEETIQTRDADALFVMIGADANTAWLPRELERDAKGYICTGRDLKNWTLDRAPFPLETSLPGVFCAGDVRHDSIKRVSSGVGEGSMAIAFVHQYLALEDSAHKA